MRFFLFTLFLFSFGCTKPDHQDLLLHKLTAKISEYDGYLIDRPIGLHRMQGYTQTDSSFGIIAVHGYYPSAWPTKGFEWVAPMKDLARLKHPVWWFRHNWFNCPDSSIAYLKSQIETLIYTNPHLDSLWVIGHSLGGLIVSNFAELWDNEFPVAVHAIAAPLKGISRQLQECKSKGKNLYLINESVRYIQWRTDYKDDGAFKHLEQDPQDVILKNGKYVLLPKTWNERRLGHTLSIQWVVDQLH